MTALPPISMARRTAMVRRAVTTAGLDVLAHAEQAPTVFRSGNARLDHNTLLTVQKLERDGMLDRGTPTRRGQAQLRLARQAGLLAPTKREALQ